MDGSSHKTTATARGEGLNSVVLGTVAYFEVNPHTSEPTVIDAIVTGLLMFSFFFYNLVINFFCFCNCKFSFFVGPNSKQIACKIDKLESGLYRGHYKPNEVGTHSVVITQKSHPITKQPFQVQVFNPAAVRILDISEAICGTTSTFKGIRQLNYKLK